MIQPKRQWAYATPGYIIKLCETIQLNLSSSFKSNTKHLIGILVETFMSLDKSIVNRLSAWFPTQKRK